MRSVLYSIGLILSFAAGAIVAPAMAPKSAAAKIETVPATTSDVRQKNAYLVASWDVLHPDQLKPFSEAVIPLAKKAGFEMLAAKEATVLEGQWPYKGTLIVQRYDSMQALLDFWMSKEHEAAKQLRAGHVDSHFVIAVEGRD